MPPRLPPRTPPASPPRTDYGRNATVTVNGAAVQSDGLNVKVVTANLDADLDLNSSVNTNGTTEDLRHHRRRRDVHPGLEGQHRQPASIGIGNVNTGSIGRPLQRHASQLRPGLAARPPR